MVREDSQENKTEEKMHKLKKNKNKGNGKKKI